MGTIVYFFKEAIRGFYQAKLMTFVAIVTIASSLFLMSLIAIGFLNIEILLRKTTDQADIAAYLNDKTIQDSVALDSIVMRVKSLSKVKNVAYIDKKTAWQRFESYYGTESLESLNENPLPASLEITMARDFLSGAAASELKKEIEAIPGIDNVQYSREWIDSVARFRLYFTLVSAVVGFVLLLSLHFMISNTIKLTIYARKELVRNMHFIGATNLFIKMPFILEGMLQGLTGGIISVLALFILKVSLSQLSIYWGPGYFPFLVIFTGVLFGWIGSINAVRKFLA